MEVKYINYRQIRSKKMELEKYPGYLPGLVEQCIDSRDWWEFLKKEGVEDSVMKKWENTRHQSYRDDVEELIKWCEDNPQYADFIIWEGE